ncbi:MAG: ribulose-phosphate 3-epimerase [Lachnospiraceae bacterium]|nr:ribulose-phosphate 3-epimerase [Lachnospiraceae bacterium]
MRAEITASIMCADLLNLERDVKALEKAGVDYFHYDIMDGHFVPNMTLGLETICEIQKRVNVRSDFHLLTKEPEDIIPLLDAGENDLISFHYQATKDIEKCITLIHELGAKAGIVLDVEDHYEVLAPYIEKIGFVNLMMITPGFAGQPMVDGMIEKIMNTRKWLDSQKKHEIKIMVDGNVNYERARLMHKLGGDILVAGSSSLFKGDMSFEESLKTFEEYTKHRALY